MRVEVHTYIDIYIYISCKDWLMNDLASPYCIYTCVYMSALSVVYPPNATALLAPQVVSYSA